MRLSNIIFDISSKIDPKHNTVVIPFVLFTKKVKPGKLLNYISQYLTIEKNNMNAKIIGDIETKISKTNKNTFNLSLVIQNKVNYFKLIIMVIKLDKKTFPPKSINNLLSLNKSQQINSQKIGEFNETFRVLGSTCIQNLKKAELYKTNICLVNFKNLKHNINPRIEGDANLAFIEGMILTMYKFDKYKTKNDSNDNSNDKSQNSLGNITENTSGKILKKTYLFNYVSSNKYVDFKLNRVFNNAKTLFFTKDLINEPSNVLTPITFISSIKHYIKQHNIPLSVVVIDRKALLKLGMNLLVSVGDGSSKGNQSKLMVLVYNPRTKQKSRSQSKKQRKSKPKATSGDRRPNKKGGGIKKTVKRKPNQIKAVHKLLENKTPDYVLVGKGVTFDTGGISLKSSKGMKEMKTDMTGAAVVSGFMLGYCANKGSKKIVGLIPLAENNIGPHATIPGDIIKGYGGKTVEIINTDAEGRLLMADCLSYATKHFNQSKLIDVSTLTGQQEKLSDKLFGNVLGRHPQFCQDIVNSGAIVNEKMVSLPYMKEFEEKMKSDIADYKNVNESSRASLMTSTAFLGMFVSENQVWAHIDIAGPTWKIKDILPYMTSEGSGFGLRLLENLIT